MLILLIGGVPGAGVFDTLTLLNTWMDPRWIASTVFDAPSVVERERPRVWRYWRALPAAGTIGLYLNGWYEDPMSEMHTGKISKTDYKVKLRRIASFERTLSDDGALILKFWLHHRARRKSASARAGTARRRACRLAAERYLAGAAAAATRIS